MDPVASGATAKSSSSPPGVAWKKRATVAIGTTHRRRTWESLCGWFRVVHSRCLYGPRKGRQAIPDVWYAMKLVVGSDSTCWEVISRHRQRGPAVRACEKDAKKTSHEAQACDNCGERPPVHFAVRTLFNANTRLCERCWHRLGGKSRLLRISTAGQKSQIRPHLPSSPDQLSFDFVHQTPD